MKWSFWTQHRHPGTDASELDRCETIDLLLSLYVDHVASEAESRRVEMHLPGCESCRESLEWMQATRRALSSRPVMLPPADLRARIAGAIAASTEASAIRSTRSFALRPAYAAAASLSVLGAIVLGHSLLTNSKVTPQNPAPQRVAVLPKTEADKSPMVVPRFIPSLIAKHPSLRPAKLRVLATVAVPDAADTSPRETAVIPVPAKSTVRSGRARVSPASVKNTHKPSRILMAKVPAAKLSEHAHAVLPTIEKHLAPLEASAPPAVIVGPALVTPQEVPHPMEASSPANEGHFQTVSLLGPAQDYVLRHSSIMEHNLTRVGNTAIRQAVRTSSLAGQEGGAVPVADIHSR